MNIILSLFIAFQELSDFTKTVLKALCWKIKTFGPSVYDKNSKDVFLQLYLVKFLLMKIPPKASNCLTKSNFGSRTGNMEDTFCHICYWEMAKNNNNGAVYY